MRFDRLQSVQSPADRDRKRWVRIKRDVAQLVDRLVAERIREGRVAMGMTQQVLADRIGIAAQQVHRYERGDSRITVGRLSQIAEVLGVSVSYFLSPQRGFERRNADRRTEEEAIP